MSNQSEILFNKIKAAVPEVVSSSGGTPATFRITQLAEGVEWTEQIQQQIDAIIAAHDWASKDNEEKLRDKADALISQLEGEVSGKTTWDNRSNAYRQEVVRQALLGLAKLARLVVRKIDTD